MFLANSSKVIKANYTTGNDWSFKSNQTCFSNETFISDSNMFSPLEASFCCFYLLVPFWFSVIVSILHVHLSQFPLSPFCLELAPLHSLSYLNNFSRRNKFREILELPNYSILPTFLNYEPICFDPSQRPSAMLILHGSRVLRLITKDSAILLAIYFNCLLT